MCHRSRPACHFCGSRSSCHARSCATRQPCFSCGRRGSCHRRSCATRQPGYSASQTQQEQQQQQQQYILPGYDVRTGELDQPPAYDGATMGKLEAGERKGNGLFGLLTRMYHGSKAEEERSAYAMEAEKSEKS